MRPDSAPIIHDVQDAEYRADPALSATGMKHLLRSPKHYRYYMDHREERAAFDFGRAVHADVLGVGEPLVEIPADVLASDGAASTKAAKAFIAEAREAGQIPLKASIIEAVRACADAVRANPKAAWLLDLPGESEIPLFGIDPDTSALLRGRLDRVAKLPDGRLVVIDLKTTTDVRTVKIRRAIEDFGYDVQSETYRLLLSLTEPDTILAPTHLIFVEVDPPHEVRVIQLAHEDWINGGRAKMRRAISLYAACTKTGEWPGADDTPGAAEILTPRPYYLDNITLEDD